MKNPTPPKLVTVAVTTTITIIFWIFFTLYQVLTKNPDPSVDQKLLEPIFPELDSSVLQTFKERIFFEEGSFVLEPENSTINSSNNNKTITEVSESAEILSQPTPVVE